MAQRIKGRLDRLKWLGDMEPEYEEILEWMNLMGEVKGVPSEDRVPLHMAVVASAMSKTTGGLTGSSNSLRAATFH
ncbi:MAG: hypothetical protein HQL67_04300 [Magnetococcales bacterium]|nr:hypothetical protein [Magnetococcales bacterium]